MTEVVSTLGRSELEADIDREIAGFAAWFENLGNAPLLPFEADIVKDYLFYARGRPMAPDVCDVEAAPEASTT